MPDGDPRQRVLTALQGQPLADPLWVCELCTRALPVTGAAIVQLTDMNRQETVCATDEVSDHLATLLFSLGEGPSVQALSMASPLLVPDLREVRSSRWPVFAEAASRTPARALYSFPLQIGVINVGVLDLYRDQPGPLTAAELAGALLCADIALAALLELRAGSDFGRAPPEQCFTELNLRRAEVHRATGMVMAQLGVSAEAALAMLRAFAYGHARLLDDVAREVVTRRLRFTPEGK